MTDHSYKVIEIVGSSPVNQEQAIQNAISRASKTVDHLNWFEMVEYRGHIENGKVAHHQVTLKVGFRLND